MEKLPEYFSFMNLTRSFEDIRIEDGKHVCWLKNHPGAADYFYHSSHGYLSLYYSESQRHVFLIISSIDDSSLPFFGPVEDKEKAERRIQLILAAINSWDGWIPDQEQCFELVKTCGMYWNK
jgi:hypothetical protein